MARRLKDRTWSRVLAPRLRPALATPGGPAGGGMTLIRQNSFVFLFAWRKSVRERDRVRRDDHRSLRRLGPSESFAAL